MSSIFIDWPEVGNRLRKLREANQIEVSSKLGITQGHLSRIESGRSRPSVEVLLALSRLYGRSINWILTGKDV